MSTETNTPTVESAPASFTSDPTGMHWSGSVGDLQEALGLEPEGGTGQAPAAPAAGDDASGAASASGDASAEAGDAAATSAEKTAPAAAEEDDLEVIRKINARSAQRRRARQAASAPAPAVAQVAPVPSVPAAAPTPAAPAVKPTQAAAPAPKTPADEVTAAVAQVMERIKILAGADGDAAATETTPAADNGEAAATRAAEVESIKAKLDEIGEGFKQTEAVKDELKQLREQLRAAESVRVVRDHLTTQFDKVAEQFPALASKRNAIDILYRGADKFYEKFKVFPNVKALAERIEKRLTAKAPENTEKKPQTRPTLSNSLSSPPAARTGPDARTKEQVENDLFSAFPDA